MNIDVNGCAGQVAVIESTGSVTVRDRVRFSVRVTVYSAIYNIYSKFYIFRPSRHCLGDCSCTPDGTLDMTVCVHGCLCVLSACLSVCLPVCLSVCLPVCVPVYSRYAGVCSRLCCHSTDTAECLGQARSRC